MWLFESTCPTRFWKEIWLEFWCGCSTKNGAFFVSLGVSSRLKRIRIILTKMVLPVASAAGGSYQSSKFLAKVLPMPFSMRFRGVCEKSTFQFFLDTKWWAFISFDLGSGWMELLTKLRRDIARHWFRSTGSKRSKTSWWFQILFIFTPIWGRFPFWLIFFRWVETTNQKRGDAPIWLAHFFLAFVAQPTI